MEKNKKVRLSLVMDQDKHKKLKIFCTQAEITITNFVLFAVDAAIESQEILQEEIEKSIEEYGINQQKSI